MIDDSLLSSSTMLKQKKVMVTGLHAQILLQETAMKKIITKKNWGKRFSAGTPELLLFGIF